MSTYIKRVVAAQLAIMCATLLSVNCLAGVGDISAGLKFGKIDADRGGSETALGVHFGYRANARISAELEFLQAEDSAADSTAIYGTYRSAGDAYFLGKIGFASIDGRGDSESGLSYGFGGGIATGNNISIEAEYLVLSSDFTFLGLTAKLTF